MTPQDELAVVRKAFARQIAFLARTSDPRIVAALAETARESFLPPGPWSLEAFGRPTMTPDADPIYVYQDVTVPVVPEKGLNNGQPSFLTYLIALCEVGEGERVVHIGAGTGYYSALLAHLAGASGRLLAIEIEPQLAAYARSNLASVATAEVVEGDGFTRALPPADAILVNAGTPRLAATWLDALRPGGRLVVPLAVSGEDDGRHIKSRGVVFRIARDADGYAARAVSPTMIYPCLGASDPQADADLTTALEGGGAKHVTRLVRGARPSACWLAGEGWALI